MDIDLTAVDEEFVAEFHVKVSASYVPYTNVFGHSPHVPGPAFNGVLTLTNRRLVVQAEGYAGALGLGRKPVFTYTCSLKDLPSLWWHSGNRVGILCPGGLTLYVELVGADSAKQSQLVQMLAEVIALRGPPTAHDDGALTALMEAERQRQAAAYDDSATTRQAEDRKRG